MKKTQSKSSQGYETMTLISSRKAHKIPTSTISFIDIKIRMVFIKLTNHKSLNNLSYSYNYSKEEINLEIYHKINVSELLKKTNPKKP